MRKLIARTAKRLFRQYQRTHPGFSRNLRALDELKILTAKQLIKDLKLQVYPTLEEAEFKVFSQFGDDGIIQYLIHHTGVQSRRFVEIGVGSYRECNTRFLLENNNWEGLVIDGTSEDIKHVQGEPLYVLHNLKAVCSFVDRDNVNNLLRGSGFSGEIGLLSIDIDGNDYWIWQQISVVQPVIVVVEYNATFGDRLAVSVPYDPCFYRYTAHYSGLFWGASLLAYCHLAAEKGYVFVGCNSAGNNAYFVKKDRVGNIPVFEAPDGFREATWRDSRDKSGHLDFQDRSGRRRAVRDLTVVDIRSSRQATLAELGLD